MIKHISSFSFTNSNTSIFAIIRQKYGRTKEDIEWKKHINKRDFNLINWIPESMIDFLFCIWKKQSIASYLWSTKWIEMLMRWCFCWRSFLCNGYKKNPEGKIEQIENILLFCMIKQVNAKTVKNFMRWMKKNFHTINKRNDKCYLSVILMCFLVVLIV